MKSEIKFISPSFKLGVTIGLFVIILIIWLSLVYRWEISIILLAFGGSVALVGLSLGVGIAGRVVYRFKLWEVELDKQRQELRLLIYQADKAQMESFILSFPASQRQLVSPNAPVKLIEATPTGGAAATYKALPEDTTQEPLDLLTVFTQATQSYACIGGQQTGKTYQMRHIASYWLNQGFTPVVVGPKWDKGEWAGCILFGGNGDFSQVAKGIAIVRQEAQKRHAADIRHKDHSILPVFFDDWTPIIDAVDNARELVLQATTLYASVNIILYFILHSDTANAWGVDRKGAALKDNFIKLFIVPHYDANGLIVRNKTRGFIKFAGDNSEYPVKLEQSLPRAKPPHGAGFNGPVSKSMESDDYINLEVEPNSTEAHILHLWEQGESFNEIARQVFGHTGGKQTEQIKQIISKFS